jgi:hypothetical protein
MKATKQKNGSHAHPEAVITKHRIPVDYNSENVISDTVTLTPEWAQDLLTRNSTNRPVNKSLIERITNDILGDRWKFNGEPIIVADSEKLLDGQHRCMAVIKSGRAIKTMLVYGVPEDRFDSIDKGASRSNSDILGAARMQYHNHLAAAAAIVYGIQNRLLAWKFTNQFGILEYLKENPGLIRSVQYIVPMTHNRRFINASVATALHYLMCKKDSAHADEFWRKVITGDSVSEGDPEYWIREKLIAYHSKVDSVRRRDDRITKRHLACLCVLAWNKSRKSQQMHGHPRYSITEDGFPDVE